MTDYSHTTLIPTHGLRVVERMVPNDRGDGDRCVRILQQLYTTTGGKPVWQDVPIGTET